MRRHAFWETFGRAAIFCWASLTAVACDQDDRGKPGDAPKAEAVAPRRDIVSSEENLYSQHGEELIIRDFFQDRTGGVFVDVGAAWPVHNSNTYYLESELGWSGVAVDAFAEHESRWRNRRPRSKFFNYIVTDHSGGVETFYRAKDTIGISTLTPGEGLGRSAEFEEVEIPTITLTDLLDQAGVSKIDLLTMDIEGHELTALSAFDIDRFKPELACIEVHAIARKPVTEYFASKGYERLARYDEHDRANYYFAPKTAVR